MPKPFLKWVGGKQRSAKQIASILPKDNISTLFEVCLGAGSIFLETCYENNFLNDVHPDLITTWSVVVDHTDLLRERLKTLFTPESNTKDFFYDQCAKFNNGDLSIIDKAAVFIYLNKHCYNGLCRYNSKGKFNTPFGKYKSVSVPKLPDLLALNRNFHFYNEDYAVFLSAFEFDSTCVVYADPPYVKETPTSFVGFNANKWTDADDAKLADILFDVRAQGAHVFVSNSVTERTRELYKGAQRFHIIPVRSDVAANPDERRPSYNYLIEL